MKEIETKVDGVSVYPAGEFNPNESELENAVKRTGLVLNELDTNQLGQAMGRYGAGGADFYVDSGFANSYRLAGPGDYVQSKVYFPGMRVVFIPGHDNTGPANINVNSIGNVPLTDSRGTALSAAFLTTTDIITAIYSFVGRVAQFRIIGNGFVIPRGMITQFYGTVAQIPAGWGFCDGTQGTPNMRNNLPIGAGGLYSPLQGGGSTNTGDHTLTEREMSAHTHSTNTGDHFLTGRQMPGHTHRTNTGEHRLSESEMPAHSHSYDRNQYNGRESGGEERVDHQNFSATTSETGGGQPHQHPGEPSGAAGGNQSHQHPAEPSGAAGGGQSHSHPDTLPPFVALVFMMKL